MRKPHLLRRNDSSETLHELIVVDTETDARKHRDGSETHHLRFGWAAYVRRIRGGAWSSPRWRRFTSPETLWEFTESCLHGKTRLHVVAHNWAFDALVTEMFRALPERGWTMGTACLDAPPMIINWHREGHTLRAIDSLNWWRQPLKTLGAAAGLPKLRMPMSSASAARWDAYCRRDVRVVLRIVTRWADFLRDNDLGGFAPTLASQAMRTYRHCYMHHDILIDADARALAMARDAYMGGRVECFRIGAVKPRVWVLDVNAMYPSVMLDGWMPTKLIGVRTLIGVRELTALRRKYCVIAHCDIEVDEPCMPLVRNHKLLFPVGRFSGTWCGPELALAARHGRILRVHTVAVYERARIFSGFARDTWAHRRRCIAAGDTVGAHAWKILSSSLYGKFGQRGRRWEDHDVTVDLGVKVWEELDRESGRWVRFRQIAGKIHIEIEEGESRDSHPAIAAHVTALARVRLWELMLQAGREHVVYCDTDSVWCTRSGYNRLRGEINPDALGALKIERAGVRVTVHGAKDYVVDGAAKIKGVRRNAQEISPGVFEQDRWRGLAGALRDGDVLHPKITRVRKRLSRKYLKGEVSPGGQVQPYRLDEV